MRPLKISEVEIANEGEPDWASRHWLTLNTVTVRLLFGVNTAVFLRTLTNKNGAN